MISSHPDLSGQLWGFIRTRVRLANPAISISPPEPFEVADYYLLASLLQKAIRRGDFQNARRAGHQLLKIAPSRLWHRLMVIALEDIGIGDLEVLVQFVALATRPQWREEFGGDLAVLDRLLAEGCTSVKDRTADYISPLITEGHHEAFPKVPQGASRAILLTSVASQELPALTRFDAALRSADMAGVADRPPRRQLAGLEALFGVYRDIGCPPLLIDACKAYSQRASDLMPIAIPLIWTLWSEEGGLSATAAITVTPNSELLGMGMPTYAFDPLHTRPGIRAVQMWLEAIDDRKQWKPRQVAAALWNYESAVCDQTLDWPQGRSLQIAAHRADLIRAGVAPERCEEITLWVQKHYPRLAQARAQVWFENIANEGRNPT